MNSVISVYSGLILLLVWGVGATLLGFAFASNLRSKKVEFMISV